LYTPPALTGRGTVVPVHALKLYRENRGIAVSILNLGIRWRWVVNFTPRPLYPRGKKRAPHSGMFCILNVFSAEERSNHRNKNHTKCAETWLPQHHMGISGVPRIRRASH